MASLVSSRSSLACRTTLAARPRRTPYVRVQAFTDSDKKSLEDINRLIGQRIKQAAAQIGTMRVWQANSAIGKYVKQAAEEAAAGKLKPKGAKVSHR